MLESSLLLRTGLTIMMTSAAFRKSGSFAECVLQEVSSASVNTKPRGIEATNIFRRQGTTPHNFILRAMKTEVIASE